METPEEGVFRRCDGGAKAHLTAPELQAAVEVTAGGWCCVLRAACCVVVQLLNT